MKFTKTRHLGLKLGIITLLVCSSCTPVREYQKMFLNDKDMELKASEIEGFESSFEAYREGSVGATGGSSGGGCGCN